MAVVIKDVAAVAGVSASSVSRVLNGSPSVSPELKAAVERAVGQLSYLPSPNARSMRTGKTKCIGVVLPDITNPFFAEVFSAIERELAKLGYMAIVCSSGEDDARELAHLTAVRYRQVDGVIMSCVSGKAENMQLVGSLAKIMPLVLIDRPHERIPAMSVSTDSTQGVFLAIEHLLELGHRRLGFVGGDRSVPVLQQREDAFRKMTVELGFVTDDRWIEQTELKASADAEPYLSFMAQAPRPTGIVSATDMTAIKVIGALRRYGLQVPHDVSVTGYDDIKLASLVTPALTTVRQPISEMGREAVEMVIDHIDKPDADTKSYVHQPRLVVRESTSRLSS